MKSIRPRCSGGALLLPTLCLLIVDASPLQAAVSDADQDAARTALLSGVNEIAVVGSPGRVAVFDPPGAKSGQGAFAVARDKDWDTTVAAALWGRGRIVAYPHPGYLDFSRFGGTDDTGRLYQNSIRWTTRSGSRSQRIVTPRTEVATWLKANGYTDVVHRRDWENALADAALLVVELRHPSRAQSAALRRFVRGGGGLISGGLGWGYQQLGDDIPTLAGNVLLREAGLGWADGFTDVNPVEPSSRFGNATNAFRLAKRIWAGRTRGTADERAAAGHAMMIALDVLPAGEPMAKRFAAAFGARVGGLRATPATPISDPLDQVILAWEAERLATTPISRVTAHRTAEAVYGAIPANPDRRRRTVAIDSDQNRWLSTGMYAEPGRIATITFPDFMVGRGYFVQLSGHFDDISSREQWRRIPFGVARRFPIDATSIQVASAFGGAIYIDVGKSGRPNRGAVDIVVDGAIQAPYFVLGETSNAAWVGGIRDYPAPYAELACDGVIISLPSAWIRTLDDPHSVMTFWNDVVARQDWVAAHESMRSNPERINHDVQISGGLLHAGYPTQGPTSWMPGHIVDLEVLRADGSWGWFHELGHEMQGRPDDSGNHYTFEGGGEVTVNIFASAAQEWRVPAPSPEGWGYANYPDEVMRRAIDTVNKASAPDFDDKDQYPFYFQLADGFRGWQTYRDVMKVYHANHAADRAAGLTNQQKKDLWLQRWSRVSGYNMVRYMVDHWRLEVSREAIDAVHAMTGADGRPLPSWMPLASSLPRAQVRSGGRVVLPLATAGLALDGTATLAHVSRPAKGTLTKGRGGNYTYRPKPGFVGTDRFSTTYRSSAGNTQTFTTVVTVHDGLSSHWPMDEGRGTRVADLGYANTAGTTRNAPTWVAGRKGTALYFDGIDDHISLPHGSVSLDGPTDFTLAAWVRTTSRRTGMIIQQRDGTEGQYNLLLDANGAVRFWIYNGGYQFNFSTGVSINDGKWHLVVAQRAGRRGRIFIDGKLDATATGPLKPLSARLPVAIGWDLRDQNKFFHGTIDDVRVYNYIIDGTRFDLPDRRHPRPSAPASPSTLREDFDGAGLPGMTLNGTAAVDSRSLRLTPAQTWQKGTAVSDPVGNRPVKSFKASFRFRMGQGSGADGIAFSVMDAARHDASALFGEAGPGQGSLTVSLDTYGTHAGDGNHAIVRHDGAILASVPVAFTLDDDRWHRADIAFDGAALTLTLTPDQGAPVVVVNRLAVPGFAPFVPRIGMGGRTGALTNDQRFDDVTFAVTSSGSR